MGKNVKAEADEKPLFSGNKDGRQSKEICDFIIRNRRTSLKLFFFDSGQYNQQRDTTLYLLVRDQMLHNPDYITITLSGNLHNMIEPIDELKLKPMGYHLLKDERLSANKILSINTIHKAGTMINRSPGEKSANIKNVQDNSPYISAYDSFVKALLFLRSSDYPYNALFYTKHISASAF